MQLIPKIRERRMEAHLSQTELAEKLGINKTHLSALERGKYFPALPLAFQIAKACNCTVDTLYSFEEK